MAQRVKAGWYPTDDGNRRYWDGKSWTDRIEPALPPDGTLPGWFPDSETSRRWWNGSGWTDARIANDGSIDVRAGLGQKIIKAVVLGGLDQPVEDALLKSLDGYPPARITQLNVYFTTFGMPATNAIAVIEWESR